MPPQAQYREEPRTPRHLSNDSTVWSFLIALGSILGCGGNNPAPPEQAAPEEQNVGTIEILDAFDVVAIQKRLGPMPDTVVGDPSNRYSTDPAAAAFGTKLFFDERYSSTGDVSCATCHRPDNGFQDPRANTSEGVAGFTGRRTPSHMNVFVDPSGDNATWYFWDGRKDSLWAQALGPPESRVEMGSSRTKVALLIWDSYKDEYEAIFGELPALRDPTGTAIAPETAMPGTPEWESLAATTQLEINQVYVNFGKAIDAYERLLVSRDSKFDRYWRELDAGNPQSSLFTDQEKLGLKTFVGKGRCISCHSGPALTNNEFTNIAIAQLGDHVDAEDTGRAGGVDKVRADEFNCASDYSDHPDKAECAVNDLSAEETDLGAFKVPSLRDISRRSPYMHTGEFKTLEETVEHYNRGGATSGFVGTPDKDIVELNLTEEESSALVAFMRTLDGGELPPHLTSASGN